MAADPHPWRSVRTKILDRLNRDGYRYWSNWARESGVPLAYETCRTLLSAGKAISAPSLMVLARYAGFSPFEIAGLLREAGDREFAPLLFGRDTSAPWERSLLAAIREVQTADARIVDRLLDLLDLSARASGVTLDLRTIRRRPHPKAASDGSLETSPLPVKAG